MQHGAEHMMDKFSLHMFFVWGVPAVVIVAITVAVLFLARRAQAGSLLVADLAAGRSMPLLPTATGRHDGGEASPFPVHDTIFLLPDISNYTRFMTGNRFAFGHAQHIVFSLINAMVAAATRTVELSKLEGDAALFFVDAEKFDGAVIGQTVNDIFAAFFAERENLMRANLCPCSACTSIADLDLKIFVHRGKASRFSFRGSVDHFGTDVIILHRIMKNGVGEKRYVMITDAAAGSINLPIVCRVRSIEEELEHVGRIEATVHSIDDQAVERWINEQQLPRVSRLSEILTKVGENVRSLVSGIALRS
jgi:hypothetical protein